MRRVVWTTPARLQLIAIQDYIAEQDPEAAHRVVNEICRKTETLLSENPRIGRRGLVSGTRELVIWNTPYIAAYRVTDRIEILSVRHGAQEPPRRF